MPTSKKILIALTSHATLGSTGKPTGAYLSETSHPHAVFAAAGFEIDFVTPAGGTPPWDGVDLKDPVNQAFHEDPAIRARVAAAKRPAEIDASAYAAIFFAGGHGTMWDFPTDAALASLAARVYDQGGVVGAVCHGPAALVNVTLASGRHLVDGKDVAAFTNDEERAVELDGVVPFLLADELVRRGARHRPAAKWQANVVTSERLVTGQNPASATGVAQAMTALLGSA
jgi:putative intracellular protease/amidase